MLLNAVIKICDFLYQFFLTLDYDKNRTFVILKFKVEMKLIVVTKWRKKIKWQSIAVLVTRKFRWDPIIVSLHFLQLLYLLNDNKFISANQRPILRWDHYHCRACSYYSCANMSPQVKLRWQRKWTSHYKRR